MTNHNQPAQHPLLASFDLLGRRPLGSGEELATATGTGPGWFHLDGTSEDAAAWLRQNSGLDPFIIDALLASATRPRIVTLGDGILLTLRGVNLNPGADPSDMISIRIWIDATRVVSLQKSRLVSIENLIQQLHQGTGPTSVGELLVAIIAGLSERMGPVIEMIDDTLDDFEERVVDPNKVIDRMELITLRQQIISLHRHLAPQVSAVAQLHAEKFDPVTSSHRRRLKESLNKLTRYVEDLDAARSRGVVIQDELANQLAQQANQRMYTVTMIAAIFLPLMLVSGLMGMNVGGIPGGSGNGFAIITGGVALLGVVAFWLVRRFKWL
ncbi:MAG: zinc transporter [Phycisphaerales bacterium]|jgi:zinc transporter